MADAILRRQVPELFTPVRGGPVEAAFVPRQTLPPRSLIGNVNIIAFLGNDAVVLRVADGRPRFLGHA